MVKCLYRQNRALAFSISFPLGVSTAISPVFMPSVSLWVLRQGC